MNNATFKKNCVTLFLFTTQTFAEALLLKQLIKMKIEINNNDFIDEQSYQKPNQDSIQNNSYSLQDKLNMDIEDTEETIAVPTFRRKPQFRFSENNKRRYS